MNTYLIFFGKSQDFTFHAFDSSQYINDFSTVIKDFDELESKIFSIDDVSNKEILSKYNFIKNEKKYSLLKIYSLGQANNGSRISGSIYGVALLSENEIEITETNNAILNTVKKNFANLCLDGVKFKTSDFYKEAETIWKALVNHKEGNYFNKINYRNGNFNTNNKVKAFYINDIIKNSFEVNNEINNASRLYFSNDLEHLKRTQGKWGKDAFPIYSKENNQFVLYTEKPKPPTPPRETDEITNLKFENAELRSELNNFERKYRKFKDTASKKFKIASILAVVFCLSTLAFFFKSLFLDDSKDASIVQQSTEQIEGVSNGDETTTEQENPVNLNVILANDDNRNTLNTLLQNIKNYETSLDKKKYSDAIIRDAKELGLEKSFLEIYEPKEDESIQLPKKVEPKKVEPKKEELKKVEPKKVEPKKVELKKVEPKKGDLKKEEPKKAEEPKKGELKKEEPKKAEEINDKKVEEAKDKKVEEKK